MTFQQPAQQGYQQPAQQGFQQPGYQQPGQLGYQQAPEPGYQVGLQQASQPTHQPVSEPAYVQDTQAAFHPNPQPVYQQPTQTAQPVYQQPTQTAQPVYQQPTQTPQPVYQQPTQTPQPVYQQPIQTAQPVLQPAYQSAPAPASQQPVPPPQAVVYQPTPGSEPAPEAIPLSSEESTPPGAGLEAYLDAQLKITQSPHSADSVQKPERLPESLSNLSDGSSVPADVQIANPSHPSRPKPAFSVTPAPKESAEPQGESQSPREGVNSICLLSSNPPTKPSTPDYPVRAVQPASPEYPPRAARLPSPDYPPQPAVASAVPWSQPPVNAFPNPPQATAVATPQAGVYPQPTVHPPPALNPQPATDPQRLSSPQVVPAQVVSAPPPVFPHPPPAISQPAVTVSPSFPAQPAYKAPGLYSLPSDASSLSSHSSTAYGGFNNQAQPQWQPDPLEAPAAIWVNGQRLTEEVTEAAEVLAGPIERGGFYWYDPVAGFWGEYGKPCQGILPVRRLVTFLTWLLSVFGNLIHSPWASETTLLLGCQRHNQYLGSSMVPLGKGSSATA
jgi:hypothetical protein